jgi:CheY-like chemotaxis protein
LEKRLKEALTSQSSPKVPGYRPVVLIVEDEALTRVGAVAMVEDAGFHAIGVTNADEAVRLLENRDDIRAVFTDIQMPGSVDGLGLIWLVRNRWPAVAPLVTSGRSSMAEVEVPNGVRFLPKPYMPSEIQTALRELIG